MIRFLTDEDFDSNIRRGLIRRAETADIITVQEIGLAGMPDGRVLTAAADQGRAILTHDATTMPAEAYQLLTLGISVGGVIVVPQSLPIGAAVEDLVLINEALEYDDIRDRVLYLPI